MSKKKSTSPAEGKAMTAEEAKHPLDEQLLRALSNNTYGTIAPWVLQDALAHLGRWRNRAFIAEEAADQFRVDLDAERAAHRVTEAHSQALLSDIDKLVAHIRVLERVLAKYTERKSEQ